MMNDAIPVNRKRRGRPATGAKLIGVRIEPDLLASLDAFAEAQRPGMGRPEAIRLIVATYLGEPDRREAE